MQRRFLHQIYQQLAQDSLYNPLWDLEGDVERSTAIAVFSDCLTSTYTQPKIIINTLGQKSKQLKSLLMFPKRLFETLNRALV